MAAIKRKLEIDKGATFRFKAVWKVGATKETVQPVDLTGYTAKMQVREDIGTPILLELTTENGGITLGGVLGSIELYVSATESSSFIWSEGVYQLELTAPNGDVSRKLAGRVVVTPEITV